MATETFGVVVRSLREAGDMSQDELAAKTQVSRTSIQNWENDRSRPRRAEFRRLAVALGLTVEQLRARTEAGDDGPEEVSADELRRLIAETEDELEYLNPKYESNRASLTAHLQRRLRQLNERLDALK
ncbi:helix-turn-helix domain-containing protein [Kribbella sp. NPDC051718]|uniref:helix-turn-helix domain-containing protein n=1 Tax=Kribbella sp. NPDC051718 TaxID=3155168 RepID=UPI00342D8275